MPIELSIKDVVELHFLLTGGGRYRTDESGATYLAIEKHQVERLHGVKYEIFSNEHSPPHFHVNAGQTKAVFDLQTGEFITGSGKQLSKLKRDVAAFYPRGRAKLIKVWNDTRPEKCPVGPVK